MERPKSIKTATYLMFLFLMLLIITAIEEEKDLNGILISVGIYSLFPYKIYNKSNFTRFLYTLINVLFIISLDKNIDVIMYLMLQTPIFYYLYKKESNEWFTTQ